MWKSRRRPAPIRVGTGFDDGVRFPLFSTGSTGKNKPAGIKVETVKNIFQQWKKMLKIRTADLAFFKLLVSVFARCA